jgi:uncharacterized protein (TIGR04551 family)
MKILLATLAALVITSPATADTNVYVPNPFSDPFFEVDTGTDRGKTPLPWLSFSGQLRLRGNFWGNLDLDRGPTPSTGLPVAGAAAQGAVVSGADMRFLFDPVIHLGSEVTIHMRLSLLENLVLGSTPAAYPATPEVPMPAGSATQTGVRGGVNALTDSIQLSRLWLEWLSPIGLLYAGRMGVDWGLGVVGNSGSGVDCDRQQVADTIGIATALVGHIWALNYAFDATGGHMGTRGDPTAGLYDGTDADDMHSVSFAVSRYLLPRIAKRKVDHGRGVFMWGALVSYRWQKKDLPSYYFTAPGDWGGEVASNHLVRRGLDAVLADLWFRYWRPKFKLEAEFAYLHATMDNASMMAGVDVGDVTADQWGGVLRAVYAPIPSLAIKLEGGVASGDPAYGFGVTPGAAYDSKPGDEDGAQADFAGDRRVDNFRFNPNYQVDELLWRRLVGTVTDGFYVRPSVTWAPLDWLSADAAVIYSRTLYAESAPGLARDLGVEGDLGITITGREGLFLRTVGAYLHPLDGYRNVVTDTAAAGAWSLRFIGGVRF